MNGFYGISHVLNAISHCVTLSSFRVYLPSKFTMTIASITARTTTPTAIKNLLYSSRIANRVPSIEMENGQSNSIIGLKYQTIVIYGCFHSAHTHTHKILILIIYLYSVFIFPFPVMLDFIHCGSNFIWFLTLKFVHLQLWHSINPNRIEFDDGAYQNGHSKL